MKSKLLVLFAIIAASAGLVAAETAYQHEVRGTVISTDGTTNTIVLRQDDGAMKTFRYASTLDVLNIGSDDYVLVRYNDDPSGGLVAVQVDETERMSVTNELPRTASPLPLLALLGLGSLAGGYSLRRRNR